MSLSEDVDLEEFVTTKDDLSGADIKAVCTEAGLLALRERRMRVTKVDFTSAREKVRVSYRLYFPSKAHALVHHTRFCTGRMRELLRDCTCRCCSFLSFVCICSSNPSDLYEPSGYGVRIAVLCLMRVR